MSTGTCADCYYFTQQNDDHQDSLRERLTELEKGHEVIKAQKDEIGKTNFESLNKMAQQEIKRTKDEIERGVCHLEPTGYFVRPSYWCSKYRSLVTGGMEHQGGEKATLKRKVKQ